jgi:hypothetical protein
LLDSETTTEDDGLDLFDEAPRYIYANNFWVSISVIFNFSSIMSHRWLYFCLFSIRLYLCLSHRCSSCICDAAKKLPFSHCYLKFY